MSRRSWFRKKLRLESVAYTDEFVFPGEPMIYSCKYPLYHRENKPSYFRNMQYCSALKCTFPNYTGSHYITPVVVILRYYVSPPSNVKLPKRALKSEKLPATRSFELCDYVLSTLEMLNHVLIGTYKQIVKLDIEKYYSDNPRTTMKFMSHEAYVKLQDSDPGKTKTESKCKTRKVRSLQSNGEGNEVDPGVCKAASEG